LAIVDHDRDTQKATTQGWGNETTSWESAEPIAEADRKEEKKDAEEPSTAPEETVVEEDAKAPEKEPEEEEQTITYDEWLSTQKKPDFSTEIRKPDQSKWEGATSLLNKKARVVEESLFGETSSQKPKSTSSSTKKSAPKKVVLEIEQRFTPIRSGRGGERGGRGGSRGTGDRGDRPERGERSDRGSGRGRPDGDRPRGRGRGEDRGGRGRSASTRGVGGGGRGGAQTIDVADTNAFPALG
jgi:plasminogen activator inhibitor 1 RNA-binding protein